MHDYSTYVSKFFSGFFLMTVSIILWTSAFYHIESSICRWYFGWEIFYPYGKPRTCPSRNPARGTPENVDTHIGFPGFTGKLIRYSSNYATASMKQILIGTAEGSRIQWEDKVAHRLIKGHFCSSFSDGFSWVFAKVPYGWASHARRGRD